MLPLHVTVGSIIHLFYFFFSVVSLIWFGASNIIVIKYSTRHKIVVTSYSIIVRAIGIMVITIVSEHEFNM